VAGSVDGVIWGDTSNPAIIDGLAGGASLGAGMDGWSGVDRVDRVDGMDAMDGEDLASLGAGLGDLAGGLVVGGAIGERTGAVAWVAVSSGLRLGCSVGLPGMRGALFAGWALTGAAPANGTFWRLPAVLGRLISSLGIRASMAGKRAAMEASAVAVGGAGKVVGAHR
jgi:hypothetical protein